MKKAFTKGDRVTVIGLWSSRPEAPSFTYRHATVHSCGTKVLRLTCARTGDEFGRELSPVLAEAGTGGVHRSMDDMEAINAAQQIADKWVIAEREHLARLIKRNPDADPGYLKGMKYDFDTLPDHPEVISYAVAIARVNAYIEGLAK